MTTSVITQIQMIILKKIIFITKRCHNDYKPLICMSFENLRIKNSSYLVDAFNVDPIYLRHTNEGKVPDYRVGTFPSFDSRSAI